MREVVGGFGLPAGHRPAGTAEPLAGGWLAGWVCALVGWAVCAGSVFQASRRRGAYLGTSAPRQDCLVGGRLGWAGVD